LFFGQSTIIVFNGSQNGQVKTDKTKAVAQLVRELNPNGRIYVTESSAFQQTRTTMAALNYIPLKKYLKSMPLSVSKKVESTNSGTHLNSKK
jgi:hypothetical protein